MIPTSKRIFLHIDVASPRVFMHGTNTAVRQGETAVLFIGRLKTLLKYYLQACDVRKFDDVVALLVSDEYKGKLNIDCLDHILSFESKIIVDGLVQIFWQMSLIIGMQIVLGDKHEHLRLAMFLMLVVINLIDGTRKRKVEMKKFGL